MHALFFRIGVNKFEIEHRTCLYFVRFNNVFSSLIMPFQDKVSRAM